MQLQKIQVDYLVDMNELCIMRIFSIFVILLLSFACGTTERGLRNLNLAYVYQVDGQVVRADFLIERTSTDSALVHYTFHTDDLLFMREKDGDEHFASVSFSYRVMTNIKSKLPVDTGNVSVNYITEKGKRVKGQFPISLSGLEEKDDQGILVVYTKDNNRNFRMVSFVKIQNTHPEQAQNWRVSNKERLLLKPFVRVGDSLSFSLRNARDNRYRVDYFKDRFTLALPPFSSKDNIDRNNLLSDSIFDILDGEVVVFTKPGVYNVRQNSGSEHGVTVYVRDGNFPFVTQKNELVGPMRYITTKREYEQLVASDDPREIKKAVDRFWLERTRNVDQSKNLISAFYSRVEKSNLLFSSYKDGWKTDRGLIFTIFGPPNVVSSTDKGERWVYGEENAHLNYVFDFVRMDNPLTDNDYELVRDEGYRYGWGLAIEAWRLGQVYNVKDIKREQDEREQQIRLRQQPYFWY